MNIEEIRKLSLQYAMGNGVGQSKRQWNRLQAELKKQPVAVTPPPASRHDQRPTPRQISYLNDLLDRKNLGLEFLRKYTRRNIASVAELSFKKAWDLIAALSTMSRTEVYRTAAKSEGKRLKAERRRRSVAHTRPLAEILALWPQEALDRMSDLSLPPWE